MAYGAFLRSSFFPPTGCDIHALWHHIQENFAMVYYRCFGAFPEMGSLVGSCRREPSCLDFE